MGENLGLKLFALLLAVLLKLYFYSPDNSTVLEVRASVEVDNVPQGQMLVEPVGISKGILATVRVRGPEPLVEQVRLTPLHFKIRLPYDVQGTYIAELQGEDLGLHQSVEIENIDPSSVEIKLERVVRKELFVSVSHQGEPAEGYRVENISVIPETVLAQGPQRELEGLSIIDTKSIDIGGLSEPTRREVALVEKGALTKLSVNVVTVDFDVRPIVTEQLYKGVSVVTKAPDGYAASVQPTKVNVTLAGPVGDLEALTVENFKVVADVRSLGAGRHQVELGAELPEGIIIVKTNPKKVNVVLVSGQE